VIKSKKITLIGWCDDVQGVRSQYAFRCAFKLFLYLLKSAPWWQVPLAISP